MKFLSPCQNRAIKASVNNQTKTIIQTSVAEAANTITSNGPAENISKVLDFTGCGSTLSFGIVVPLSQSSPIWVQFHVPRTAKRLAETGPATDFMKFPPGTWCATTAHIGSICMGQHTTNLLSYRFKRFAQSSKPRINENC
jgi:hypothetical protein